MESPPDKDFFISYNKTDRTWAEWIAWQLEAAGYLSVVQAWDFRPGGKFVLEMHAAMQQARRTIAVLSPDYLAAQFTQPEWAEAFRQDPTGEKGLLLPVRVRECDIKGLLGSLVYIDLVELDEIEAHESLITGVRRGRAKPSGEPSFPGSAQHALAERPAFPGAFPPFWQVPHRRNPAFTGRETLLDELHTAWTSGKSAALTQAIAGLGGMGKTQLALEYSYRHAHEYAGLWWFRAETPETLVADYVTLADAASLPERESTEREATVKAVRRWLEVQEKPWLLVFDNAKGPGSLRDYLPKRAFHHVLVTSRNPALRGIAKPLEVKVFERQESTAFLIERTGSDEQDAANTLADELGDLPLALEQAGAYIESAGLSLSAYLERYRTHRAKLLARGNLSTDYPDTVATTWSLAIEAVEAISPAGAALLNVLAFLAPDAIPKSLIVEGAEHLPEPLAEAIKDRLGLDEAVAALRRHSLMETTGGLWSVHRLVQAVTRDRLGYDAATWAEAVVVLINHTFPYKKDDLTTWALSEALLPHALAAAEHAEALGVGLEATGRVQNQAGIYLMDRSQLNEARHVLERALSIGEQVYGPNHPNIASAASNIGVILKDQGNFEEALIYAKRALAINERAYGLEHPRVAIDIRNISLILENQGNLEEALTYAKRALALNEQAYWSEHPTTAHYVQNIGAILKEKGDLKEALTYAKRALAINERTYGLKHPRVAVDVNNIGVILKDQGNFEEALTYAKRALAIDEQTYGSEHPAIAIDFNNIGAILQAQGDLEEALSYAKRALAVNEQVYGPDHLNVAVVANNIGAILQAQGDLEEALTYAKRALAIDEKVYETNHPTVAIRANNIGMILKDQGDLSGALSYSKRALAINERVYGPDHHNVAAVASNIGLILVKQGDADGALTYAKRAVNIFEDALGPEHPNTKRMVQNLATLERSLRK